MKNIWALMQRSLEGPAWRWMWAQRLVSARPGHNTEAADPLVREAAAYLRRFPGLFENRGPAAALFPLLFAAEKITHDPQSHNALKIMTLGNCCSLETASRLKLEEERVRTWEKLFFDVRENLSALDWIVAKVLNPEKLQDPALAAKLRLAYIGGPVAARAILDCDSLPYALGDRIMDRRVRLMLKADQALAMPMTTSAENFRFARFYSRWRMEEKRLELAVRKLEHRCAESLRRHERVLERAQERTAARRAQTKRFHESALAEEAAEKEAARARAAASPLAKLTWRTASAAAGLAPVMAASCTHLVPDILQRSPFYSQSARGAADGAQAPAKHAVPA